jgi:hypothetical protein
MPTVYINTDVEIDLDSFDTDDLLEELDRRGVDYNTREMRELLEQIYLNRRVNKNYDHYLDQLIYGVLGRLV